MTFGEKNNPYIKNKRYARNLIKRLQEVKNRKGGGGKSKREGGLSERQSPLSQMSNRSPNKKLMDENLKF